MKKNVKLNWLSESMIVPAGYDVIYKESDGSGDSDKFICKKWDDYYNKNKEKLWERCVYFINIKKTEVVIYLRPEGWEKRK